MIQNQQDTTQSIEQWALDKARAQYFNPPTDPESIQLQSPEAVALNGLLSDLEFMANRFQSMADYHWSNYKDEGTAVDYSRKQNLTAFGIYSNKAQDMWDLVNKWKPNKK